MANGFLTPFLSGALGEYSRQEERNDEIISKIIDSVANKVLNEEIPNEEKLINDAMSYKNQYTASYGADVSQVLDAAGVFENPTDQGVENALQRFFGTKDYSLDSFKTKIESYKKDSPDKFDTLVGSTFTDQRTSKLEDRKDFVGSKFSDTPSIRDLIISPERKEMTGVTGLMFGNRVDKMEQPGATSRLYEATKPDSSMTVSPLAIKSELGIDVPTEVQPFMTEDLFRKLTNDGETRFDKDYKSQTVKRTIEGKFGVPKPDESIRKSQPEIYEQQKKAYEDFQKLPSGDKENIYRQNFVKDYISKQIQGMVQAGVPGAAGYQNNQLATGIAQSAFNKISQLQSLENQPPSQPGESYNADEDIEKIKQLARERITSLGLNPEDYGI